MPLTPQQLATLKADIAANTATVNYGGQLVPINQLPNNSDANFAIAEWYNAAASPAFVVWRTAVPVPEIMANGFRWTDVDGLTPGKARIWEWMTALGTINPSKTNIRAGLAECWGGANTAQSQAIMPHLKRSATRLEKLLATGTGSDATPATMGFEGAVSYQDIETARNLP